ncbi:MAG: SpoIIE family protein phosphatase [Spirochaetes bacterium]|jgi:sigma-B regulation protein RsbU (phosphoserine phosphatase)|nr:SpoIIE family protein phosphatase [Spirochaetota bacterium]
MAKSDAANKNVKPVSSPAKQGVRFSLRIKFSLAIIGLATFIILTITLFVIWREWNLLENQIIQFVEREVVHLSNTAQQSINVDELAMFSAVNDLKKIPYIKYAFVMGADDTVIQYFDRRQKRAMGELLNDGVDRRLKNRTGDESIKIIAYDDPGGIGDISDFSKIVTSKVTGRKIGAVVIGLSDIIIRNEVANLLMVIIPISLIFLGLSIIGSIVLASITIKPVRELSRGAAIIGAGNLDYKIGISTSDELGQLAREFNLMTSMIKTAREKEIESRILDEQLEMARDIQEGLNPMGFYEKAGIQIKGFTRAAKGVGGDYFDYKDIDENRVGALISDVSGKGVPASLVMVMIRTVFTSYISRGDVDCSSVASAINDALSADFAIDKFATLFFMIYDRKTEELSFANAGHGPLYCYRAETRTCTATRIEDVPIGIMDEVRYKQARIKLNPGDMIVLNTDGITEMRNTEKEEYGLSRLLKNLLEKNYMNASDFVDFLVQDVDGFRGEANPHDDMTILVLKRVQ